jgi:hypothetical protein
MLYINRYFITATQTCYVYVYMLVYPDNFIIHFRTLHAMQALGGRGGIAPTHS